METVKKFLSKKNVLKILRWFLIASMILTITFIFGQSLKSQEKSAETSEKVEQIIEPILPSDTPVGGYVQDNIRKIAHFVEFFFLGAECAAFVAVFLRKRTYVLYSYLFSVVVALLDETIQIFSDRGSSVADVWLDIFGFAVASSIVYVVWVIYFRFKKVRTSESNEVSGDV